MKTDLVCGMNLTSTFGCEFSRYDGTVYYFCGADCKKEFDKNPDKYINNHVSKERTNSEVEKVEWERDPVCGDMIKISDAKAMSIYKCTRYYFCCPICKREFDKNPSVYADREEGYFDPDNPNDFMDGIFRIL